MARWRKLKGVATVRLSDDTIRLAEVHWFEAHGIGKRKCESSGIWIKTMAKKNQEPRFAVCISSDDPDLLTPRRIYQVLPDGSAAKSNHLRVVDNEGEDYLYPADYFLFIELPREVELALLKAA
jgi:hypothetical protein